MVEVRIVPFDTALSADFARLNYEWINEYFEIEPPDREMLDNPERYIIWQGGQIFFAMVNEIVVGTVALIREGNDQFELAKMAVSPDFKGQGIGDRLIEACIKFSKEKQMSSVFLLSNTKLVPAINLYRKHGFVETPLEHKSPYERVNIRMELALDGRNR